VTPDGFVGRVTLADAARMRARSTPAVGGFFLSMKLTSIIEIYRTTPHNAAFIRSLPWW